MIGGLLLGVAVLVHITAVLFVPFFFVALFLQSLRKPIGTVWYVLLDSGLFLVGIGIGLAVLAYYNFSRFGNWLETGRTVEGAMRYGGWTVPWRGLYGLLFSAGKGVFFYCPAIIFGLCFWQRFYSTHKVWAISLMAACVFRLIFISARSDWSGGLCLGPRYLLLALPFLLIPIGIVLGNLLKQGKIGTKVSFGVLSFLCIAQQIYFALGEVFSFWRLSGFRNGVNLFKGGAIYESWDVSPLLFLLSGPRGPLLLRSFPLSNWVLFLGLCVICGLVLALVYLKVFPPNKS